ncbi:putative serine esterase [Hyaloraphidium curvatum]|nr:putative serine esterase [Hyaloraphidium curvatum]
MAESEDVLERFRNPETTTDPKGRVHFQMAAEDVECTLIPRPLENFASTASTRTRHFPTTPGRHPLNMGGRKDGFVVVPNTYDDAVPAAMLLSLHGATGTAIHQLSLFEQIADLANVILVVPESRVYTWDLIASRGQGYGDDVAFLNHVLWRVFQTYNVNPDLVAVGGFSDGASYAASIGVSNGELFRTILANSPGFAAPLSAVGRPRVFVSHGNNDKVLPIAQCSRRLVPVLKNNGYTVEYVEFHGGHEVPKWIVELMVEWWLGGARSGGGTSNL